MRHHVLQCRDHQGHGQQHARQRERQVAAQDHHAGGENGVADGVGTDGGHRVRGGWGTRTLSSGSPRPARALFSPRVLARAVAVHAVDQAPLDGFVGCQVAVAVQAALDVLIAAAAMLGVQPDDAVLGALHFLGVDHDVRGLALEAAQRLVHVHAGVGQRGPFARLAGHQQQRAHGARRAHAQRVHGRLDELHGVVHGQAAGDHAAGRIDVQVDGLAGMLGLQEQQLRAHQRRNRVVDLAVQEHDAFAQQARIDIERPFSAAGLFHHHGDELHRSAHERTPCVAWEGGRGGSAAGPETVRAAARRPSSARSCRRWRPAAGGVPGARRPAHG